MRQWAWLAVGLACASGAARGADLKTLRELQAPPATVVQPLPSEPAVRTVKFARIIVDLPPEPWARVERYFDNGAATTGYSDQLISWQDGATAISPKGAAEVVASELKAARIPVEGAADSVFANESTADLLIGVKINGLQGRFCLNCKRFGFDGRWRGAVVMDARWEIYSAIDRKVLATIPTHGGFATKDGLDGEPERLIFEALRDNVRGLIAAEEFRRIITTSAGENSHTTPILGPLLLKTGATHLTAVQAASAVAIVFAADGSGSGFLVSNDGYLITNRHVVGGSKYVKLKWADGSETLGEVIRSDPRRDVALVKADAHGRAPLDLRSGAVEQGEAVFAIGSPLGEAQQNTMTKGIVSATRMRDGLPYIQSDVAVTHGNSGGPLLDEKGRVIGITVSGLAPNGSPIGLNFFIPIDDALKALSLSPAG